MGSGFSTIPSPPPNGRSSTVRWRSWVNVREIVDANFNEPSLARLAHDAVIQRPAKKVRKNRQDLELHL